MNFIPKLRNVHIPSGRSHRYGDYYKLDEFVILILDAKTKRRREDREDERVYCSLLLFFCHIC